MGRLLLVPVALNINYYNLDSIKINMKTLDVRIRSLLRIVALGDVIMNKDRLSKIINKINTLSPYFEGSDEYKLELEKLLLSLSIHTNKIDNKIEKMLVGDQSSKETIKFSYNQGISELMLWFLLEKYHIRYNIEVRLNSESHKDIDLQFNIDDITYNIEVKSPNYPLRSGNNIRGMLTNRFPGNEMMEELEEINRKFNEVINTNSFIKEQCESAEILNLRDNKIKDCLVSAHSKFANNSEKVCNILLICTTSLEMCHYLNYLKNPCSGLLTENSFSKEPINNVKAVILSNAISMNEKEVSFGWDLDNSINLLYLNDRCDFKDNNCVDNFLRLFPNSNEDFYKKLCKVDSEQLKEYSDSPWEIRFLDFINEKFNMNKW